MTDSTDKAGTEPLKPCPFCGSTPIVHSKREHGDHQPVECPNKKCVMSRCWPDLKDWNRRTTPPPTDKAGMLADAWLVEYANVRQLWFHNPIDEAFLRSYPDAKATPLSIPSPSYEAGVRRAAGVCREKVKREAGHGGRWEGYGSFYEEKTGSECADAILALLPAGEEGGGR